MSKILSPIIKTKFANPRNMANNPDFDHENARNGPNENNKSILKN